MNDILKMVTGLLISVIIVKILMNLINLGGIDFIGFFEDVWKKMRAAKR